MASRWVDSGINWAGLTQYDSNFSFVVNELYLAYSEKRAIVKFIRITESSVPAWDVANVEKRMVNQVDEIIEGFKYMLDDGTGDTPITSTDRYCYLDYTADISLYTPNRLTKLSGLPMFTLDALGGLESITGSLARIRDWNPADDRIDSDLLTLIYKVLIALDTVGMEYTSSLNFINSRYFKASTLNERYTGTDVNYATALAEYIADTPNSTGSYESLLEVEESSGAYTFTQWRSFHTYGADSRDSKNVVASTFNYDIYWYNDDFGDSQLSTITYFDFTKTTGITDTPIGVVSHPFTPWPTPATNEVYQARARSQSAVKLDVSLVEYYT